MLNCSRTISRQDRPPLVDRLNIRRYQALPTVLLLVLSLVGASGGWAQQSSEDLVRSCFERYRTAIMSGQAGAAYAEINQNTKAYYDDMLDKVLYLSAAEVKSLTALEKIFIAQSRHRIPLQELQAFDGEGYFKYAVEQGWVGRDSVANAELTNITVSGDSATSAFVKKDKTLPFGFSFSLENGDWKIDLISIIPISNLALQHMINNAEEDEQTIIFKIVETLSGETVDETIWDAPAVRE